MINLDSISIEGIEEILCKNQKNLKYAPDISLQELSTEIFSKLDFKIFDTVSSIEDSGVNSESLIIKEFLLQLNKLDIFERPLLL